MNEQTSLGMMWRTEAGATCCTGRRLRGAQLLLLVIHRALPVVSAMRLTSREWSSLAGDSALWLPMCQTQQWAIPEAQLTETQALFLKTISLAG